MQRLGLKSVEVERLTTRIHELEGRLEFSVVELETGKQLVKALENPGIKAGMHAASSVIAQGLKMDLAAFIFKGPTENCLYATSVAPDLREFPREDFERLAKAASSGEIPRGRLALFSSCFAYGHPLLFAIPPGEDTEIVLIGVRNGRSFNPDERSLFRDIATSVGPALRARLQRDRDEYLRRHMDESQRKGERRLRAFFMESQDMIYSANSDDVIATINDSGLAMLGHTDRFDIIGRRFSEFALNPEDRENFWKRLRERRSVKDFEIVLKRADGSVRFCLETAHLITDPGDGTIELQGIIKDITERITSERELLQKNLELGRANRELQEAQDLMVQQEKMASIGQLAAGIAHEINNPLGFLKSNHGTLLKFFSSIRDADEEISALHPEGLEEIRKRHDIPYVLSELDAIMKESEEGYRRIMEIVKALKNFSREEQEKVSEYDINAGVSSTLIVASNEIKYVATVEKRLNPVPPFKARGNELNQVILNLVVNAAQAIGSNKSGDKGTIRVSTGVRDSRVFLWVEDNGPGVPPEIRNRIFDPFFTTKAPGKGTGLGLSISYDIVVRKHGGEMRLEDSDLGGARFVIELPLSPPNE